MALTMAQTYAYARQAGFDPASAVIMSAIAMGESGLNPSALGDVSLQDAQWGPSVGLTQVRTLKADTGTGRTRDIQRLSDPLQNLTAAYQISNGGKNWTPWTIYNDGSYRQYLGQAQSAAAGGYVPGATVVQPAGMSSSIGAAVKDAGVVLVVVGLGVVLVVAGAVRATDTGGLVKRAGKAGAMLAVV